MLNKLVLRKIFRPLVARWLLNHQCEYEILGSEYGSWPLPTKFLGQKLNCVTFGVGEDLSFEIEVSKSTKLHLTAFDPTSRAAAYYKSVRGFLPDASFYQKAVVGNHREAYFSPPEIESHVSVTAARAHSPRLSLDAVTVGDIKDSLFLRKADIIKMDIEGFENTVVPELIKVGILPEFYLIEFHHYIYEENTLGQTLSTIKLLEANGYGCFYISKTGTEYGFRKKCVDS